MKRFLKFIILVLATGYVFITPSCDSYLEFPLVSEFNEDSVFSKRVNVEKYLMHMYVYNNAKLPFASSRLDRSLLDAASDIGSSLYVQSAYGAHKFNKGTVTAEWVSNESMGEDVFYNHYKAIRIGWKLIDRVDEVPDATQAQKDRIKADAKTMIAMHYFEMLKRYGGVPLVKKALLSSGDAAILRSSVDETYKYIIQLCDEVIAAPNFPVVIKDKNEFGRASKALAMGIKSRTLLLIASPLFNNNRPYLDNLGANSNLICLMNLDNERWKMAADAALQAIDSCESGTGGMMLTNTGNNDMNYTNAYQQFPSKGNTEMIMVFLGSATNNFLNWKPRGAPFNGFSSNVPTFNYVEMFQKKDGTYRDWDNDTISPVNQPSYPYKDLDPRFAQIIGFNGQIYPELTTTSLEVYDDAAGNPSGKNGKKANAQFTHYLNKFIYGYLDNTSFTAPKAWRPYTPYLRLTELYLNRAEALNEYYGNEDSKPVDEVYARINAIRQRSGMLDLDENVFNTKTKVRELIQRERAIELGFEDSRFFDLKRWRLGNKFRGPIYDLKIKKLANNRYTFTKYVYEVRPWFENYYLHPFPVSEVNKQYGLIQNPGW